jgi:hypothetical protein
MVEKCSGHQKSISKTHSVKKKGEKMRIFGACGAKKGYIFKNFGGAIFLGGLSSPLPFCTLKVPQ